MEKEIRLSNRGFVSSQESLKNEISWIRYILSHLEMNDSHKELENEIESLLLSLIKTQEAVEDFRFKLNSILYDLFQEVESTHQESQIVPNSFESSYSTSLF